MKWPRFAGLASRADGREAVEALIAQIEHGAELGTFDGDFGRFAGLRWTLLRRAKRKRR